MRFARDPGQCKILLRAGDDMERDGEVCYAILGPQGDYLCRPCWGHTFGIQEMHIWTFNGEKRAQDTIEEQFGSETEFVTKKIQFKQEKSERFHQANRGRPFLVAVPYQEPHEQSHKEKIHGKI